MVSPVTGFITSDNTFYYDKVDARLHEAHKALTEALIDVGVDAQEFIQLCESHTLIIEEFLNALQHKNAETKGNPTNNREAKGNNASVQSQQADRYVPMSNMGSGS